MLRFPVAKYRSKIVKDLWKITEEYNTLHPTNWTDEVTQIMKDYQTFVVKVRIHQIVSPIHTDLKLYFCDIGGDVTRTRANFSASS